MRNSIVFLFLCLFPLALFGRQSLDEMEARKARYSDGNHTYYTGEDVNYIWQPESLSWRDTYTNHEVFRLAFKYNNESITSKEYAADSWNYNGSALGFYSFTTNRRVSSDPNLHAENGAWIVNSDGSKIRGARIAGGRSYPSHASGWVWARTEDAVYMYGGDASYQSTGDTLYKCVRDSNNSFTCTEVIDLDTSRAMEPFKGSMASDDSSIVMSTIGTYACSTCPNTSVSSIFFYRVKLDGSPTIDDVWGAGRNFGPSADPYGGHSTSNETTFHGGALHATAFHDYLFWQYSRNGGVWWNVKLSGTAADGGPAYEDWDGDSFGAGDVLHVYEDLTSAQTPHNPENLAYLGHPSLDRWGTYILHGCAADPGDGCIWGDNCEPGTVIIRVDTGGNPVFYDASNSNYPLNYEQYDGNHHSWTGWTDYVIGVDITDRNYLIENQYNKTTQTGKENYQAQHRFVHVERPAENRPGSGDTYWAHPLPIQSPDGTKVAFHTVLFHADWDNDSDDDDLMSIAYAVAYYPHPPEITSCTQSGGTVTVTFEWMLDTTPRGYTSRGWPDESTNNPPPPRETKMFRLWRSADKATWTPLGTVDAEIFTRYDFATGVWSGNDYWTITDTPGAGTWYYAVTSVEWSGLESHCLGNIYAITIGSGNGAQDTAYPASPGDLDNIATSDFHTSFVTESKSIIRHYNIYAEDGSAPTVSQTNRIATIPVSACSDGSCSWVDWLGATDGSTQYVVTAVDTQGNESNSTFVTTQSYSALETDGQYSITWDDMYEAYDDGGLVSGSSTTVSGTVNWH